MYEHFLYDGVKHITALSVESLRDRCVVLSGFSKVFSITGWRLGYAIAPAKVIEVMAQFNDLIYVITRNMVRFCYSKPLEVLEDAAQRIRKLC